MHRRTYFAAPTMALALATLAGLGSAEPLRAQDLHWNFDVRSGQRLTVDLRTGGSLAIEGWDRDVVAIEGTKRGRDCEAVQSGAGSTAAGVELRTEYRDRRDSHRCELHFTIQVPRRFDLELETMGGGFRITDVEGTAEGETMGGSLELSRLRGEVRLTTMGGNIELADSEVDGEVSTMGGRVRLVNVIGDVDGHSMGGNVIYENVTDRSGRSTGREVRITTMGGGIDVSDAPAGADVETMGGNIRIGSARDHVRAKTMGGTIEIRAADGWIEATTMGGDIDARMVGDPATGDRHVELVSMSGDVTLVVPEGLSMEIDVEIAYTRDSDRDYRIVSDFPLEREESQNWEHDGDWGSPRKFIHGRGSVAGGEHRIRIETVNGNVHLRRGQ